MRGEHKLRPNLGCTLLQQAIAFLARTIFNSQARINFLAIRPVGAHLKAVRLRKRFDCLNLRFSHRLQTVIDGAEANAL